VPEDVIPLTAADPDFPCAPQIADSICRFVKERHFCYGPAEGLPEFKESMAGFYRDKRDIPASPGLILPVDSAAYGIYVTCKAFLSMGDEAIIFDPVDFLFRYCIEAAGGTALAFGIPPGNQPVDFERLEQMITRKTRMICLCNPLNPTGKVFTKEELLAIGRIACQYNLIILSDEIWSDIIFSPNKYTSIASLGKEVRDRTITITGFSKSYGLAGLRIGTVMASGKTHYNLLLNASQHKSTVHGTNLLSQVAAMTAINECGEWLSDFLRHLHVMRETCVSGLNAVPGFSCIQPQGCYVAFANITATGKTSAEIQELLFNEAKVAVVPGLRQWFGDGAEGYIRLSFATSEKILKTALDRIRNTMKNTINPL
jgi:aspartate/methionine/tyrosine aminotransferase